MRLPLRSAKLPGPPLSVRASSQPAASFANIKARLTDPLTSVANLMPSQREQVAVESLVQQHQQEQDSYPYPEPNQHDMNQSYHHLKDSDFAYLHDNPPMMNNHHVQEMMNSYPPPYEPPMLPPMSPYPPGPGPGGPPMPPNSGPMQMGFPSHMQQHHHSMGPPQYHQGPMMNPGPAMSPNFQPPPPQQQQQQQQPSQGPMFSHVPPGANLISQNPHFPPRRSSMPMGPPGSGMMGGPPGMGPGPPPGMPIGVPCLGHLESRIHAMNQRFRMRNDEGDNAWWEAFAQEFFEDEARLTVRILIDPECPAPPEKQQIQYSIGRALIPRFFRSFFEGGVIELQYEVHHSRESLHNGMVVLDCGQAVQITTHCKPAYCKVFSEGRLIVHFSDDDGLRIRSWVFIIVQSHEFIPRNVLANPSMNPQHSMYDPGFVDHMCKPVAAQGLLHTTVNFLKMCAILEPMQEIMAHHKSYPIQEPRECMKNLVFQKWKDLYAPPVSVMPPHMQVGISEVHLHDPEAARGTAKRRKRKTTGGGRGAANSLNNSQNGPLGGVNPTQGPITLPASKKGKNSHNLSNQSGGGGAPATPGMPLASQDVMIVGEPTLMGGEFGDEDERLITRLENSQYDPHLASQAQNFPSGNVGPGVPPNDQPFTSTASSPRNSGHGPPSVGSWQQNARPASAAPSINNDGKNRSPNH